MRIATRCVAVLAASLVPLFASAAEQAGTATSETRSRPPVGLVLGGGGAMGAAHIGVLKVLEEMRVPVDCIAGTSMGALVGGAYASGMPAAELERFVTGIDWENVFKRATVRRYQPMSVKRDSESVSNKLEFGVGASGLTAPRALVETQQVESLLREMVRASADVNDFDRLPIPFRAVATDLKSGGMVVFRSGDLPTALRASMSVPGAFAPIEVGDWLLVDGGITRNLPVDVARETCADAVIAIAVDSPEPETDSMRSATGAVGRMIDILIERNEEESLESLVIGDVGLQIVLEGVTSADFHLTRQAIAQGERAARGALEQFESFSVSPEDYAAWRASLGAATVRSAERRVQQVRFDGVDAETARHLRTLVRTRAGDTASDARAGEDALRVYATGAYESVAYRFEGPADTPALVFSPIPKTWGPNYLSFDYGVEASLQNDAQFVASVMLRRAAPEAHGREWRVTGQLGRESLVEASMRQPLGSSRRFFVLPSAGIFDELEDLYQDGERIATYRFGNAHAELRAGVEMGTWGELQLGLYRRRDDLVLDIGDPSALPEFRDYDDGGYVLDFERDTRDSDLWATRGSRQRLEVLLSDTSLGAWHSYGQALFEWNESQPFGRALLFVDLAGGATFKGFSPPQQAFRLGGPGALSGLQSGELRGEDFAYGQLGLGWRLTDLTPLLGMTLYGGGALEAGNVWKQLDGTTGAGLLLGGRLFIGGQTPFGPVSLSLGYLETGDYAVFLNLGRPVRTPWR
jgi:NTE family protein